MSDSISERANLHVSNKRTPEPSIVLLSRFISLPFSLIRFLITSQDCIHKLLGLFLRFLNVTITVTVPGGRRPLDRKPIGRWSAIRFICAVSMSASC